jgi:hypothetical protein
MTVTLITLDQYPYSVSFSKVCEKIVQTRLTLTNLDTLNLITTLQFGFRPGHSTSHPVSQLLNKVTTALNDKKHSIVIFCDLKKYLIPEVITLYFKNFTKKGSETLECLRSYLTDRLQFVTIGSYESILLTVLTGMPQGFLLGPLLFLLYIKQLTLVLETFSLLFADNTVLAASQPQSR